MEKMAEGLLADIHTFLKILEDNDAVIHMCIKARAPKLRHLGRTLRIDLDWLFERFSEDPAISITYINTKSQLADIFTKASFTAPQWGSLLRLIQTCKSSKPLEEQVVSDAAASAALQAALAKDDEILRLMKLLAQFEEAAHKPVLHPKAEQAHQHRTQP